ncbi:MAG TPA: Fur family transcriptional regulator [Gaiellaceae bacterium]
MSDWTSQTLEELQRTGYRSGGARRAVIQLLGRQECCLTAQQIFDGLREEGRGVGIASVYRILDLLADQGFVQRVEIGDAITRFEPAHAGGDHHHHLVCNNCGKVEAFEDERLEQALRQVERKTGYTTAGHDVLLRGACQDCR